MDAFLWSLATGVVAYLVMYGIFKVIAGYQNHRDERRRRPYAEGLRK